MRLAHRIWCSGNVAPNQKAHRRLKVGMSGSVLCLLSPGIVVLCIFWGQILTGALLFHKNFHESNQ